MRRCAEREETWINADIEESYRRLHERGHAHSIECWHEDELVGGLYGVNLGAAFFGESMFSARRDASKVALAWLVARLRVGGYVLLDCQFMTDHLRSLGAVEVTQEDYLALLESALSAGGSGRLRQAARAGAAGPEPPRGAGAEFGALDRLLAADAARTVDCARLRMRHRAALGPDVVDRVLDDVERRRLLVEPAREDPLPAPLRIAHVELDEGAGQLLHLPGRGGLAGAQADRSRRRSAPPGRASGRSVAGYAVALVEEAEHRDPLRHRRRPRRHRGDGLRDVDGPRLAGRLPVARAVLLRRRDCSRRARPKR